MDSVQVSAPQANSTVDSSENDDVSVQPEELKSSGGLRRGCVTLTAVFGLLFSAAAVWAVFNSDTPELSEDELAQTRGLVIDSGTGEEVTSASSTLSELESTSDDVDSDAGNDKFKGSNKTPGELLSAVPNSGIFTDLFDVAPPKSTEHPLDTSLAVARYGLRHIRDDVDDYTATLIKRERFGKKLGDEQYMHLKIRSERKEDETIVQPLSVYIKFLKPRKLRGQESIWVKGENDDKIAAHGSGITRLIKVNLAPLHRLAMSGNRYPISEIGIEQLAFRMLQKGRRDRKHDECTVKINRSVRIDDRPCTRIEITHPVKRDHFEFHVAELYIDDQFNIPVRYASWSWPKEPGGEKVLEEEYTYRDIRLNVGLTDEDFDQDNPEYQFP